MSPALHAVARLIECPCAPAGLASELSEALAGETSLSIATRLRLVALAARLEADDDCECRCNGSEPAGWVVSLAESFLRDEASALEALVAHAPRLRSAVARTDDRACPLPAMALLELLGRRVH